jgi:ATP-dependent RNA helicase SUPV3L1/SUV3
MPETTDADFVAIDEVQIAVDLERGHFFTDRILNLRGKHETMLLGADTMLHALRELLPGINIITRPRMSVLSYASSKKITRMPSRSAIVAFSADEVYAIAELVRRERGGAAVVTGSLSPRTRNAQVALYQSGDVDFLIATDAIGMGLNLDVNHVAFAQDSKFDGHQYRKLTAAELGQVAGRAGRYTRDGTFGVTSRVQPFSDELVEALETHIFAPYKVLTWRNRDLDFSSVAHLQKSLEKPSDNRRLMRAPPGTDIIALETLLRDRELYDLASHEDAVRLLWEVAKVPDYRKISPTSHAEILSEVYTGLMKDGHIREDWFAELVDRADNTHGEIDALSTRIASVRTCTYLSNRENWLENAREWREKTREVEDRLSDALHETLTKRFIDRRTSVLMKRLKENRMLEAEIAPDGKVSVEGHDIGTLRGFRFSPDTSGGKDTKALNAAASKVLSGEIEKRSERLSASPNSDIVISNDGSLRWLGEVVAKLGTGDTPLKPKIVVLADEYLTGPHLDKVAARLDRWIANHINTLLKPFSDLENNQELNGTARGISYRLLENLGSIDRKEISNDLKNLDQDMRGAMRRNGVRFGAYNVFIPALLKPAPTQLVCLLWAVANDKIEADGLSEVPELSSAGRTSAPVDESFEPEFYRLAGFRVLGKKAVRIDILERLADLIRPTTLWKPESGNAKPEGAIDGKAFYVTPAMMSILGATHEDMEVILKSLGYKGEPRLETEVKPASEIPVKAEKPEAEKIAPESSKTPQETSEVSMEGEAVAEASLEEPEEKKILIWRFGGMSKGGKNAPRNRNNRHDARGKQGNKKPSGNKPNNRGPQKKDKPLDPDSPFAALAALKSGMQNANE